MANYSTLQMGSSGQDVEKLQNALINAGYDLEGGADGVFGSKTDAALREYQKANGLTVDGIAGNQTLGKLYGGAGESGPTEYEKSMQELGELKDAWLNRPDFQYDMSKDPFYQQYRDQFMSQGQLAMMDTMGQAAALTGGYGSTYAQAAGQQAYQAYLQQLNDVMPELYGMARDQYDREGEDLYNRLSMMMAEQEAAANIMAQTGDYTRLGDLYGLSPDEIAKMTDLYGGSGGGGYYSARTYKDIAVGSDAYNALEVEIDEATSIGELRSTVQKYLELGYNPDHVNAISAGKATALMNPQTNDSQTGTSAGGVLGNAIGFIEKIFK